MSKTQNNQQTQQDVTEKPEQKLARAVEQFRSTLGDAPPTTEISNDIETKKNEISKLLQSDDSDVVFETIRKATAGPNTPGRKLKQAVTQELNRANHPAHKSKVVLKRAMNRLDAAVKLAEACQSLSADKKDAHRETFLNIVDGIQDPSQHPTEGQWDHLESLTEDSTR